MKLFENISKEEKELLLKIPVYVSLLAANADGEMDEQEKKEAIELTHIKTYNSDPQLIDYYKEVEIYFKNNIEKIDKSLPKGKSEREAAIKKELLSLDTILLKVEKSFSFLLNKSLQSYTEHVSKAHRNSLEFFLFPLYIKGIND